MISVSLLIGAYAIQNAMFDIWLMLGFGVVGYVFKKIGIPLAPFTLALVLGNRAEDAFRLSMIGAAPPEGVCRTAWSVRCPRSRPSAVLAGHRQGDQRRRKIDAAAAGAGLVRKPSARRPNRRAWPAIPVMANFVSAGLPVVKPCFLCIDGPRPEGDKPAE